MLIYRLVYWRYDFKSTSYSCEKLKFRSQHTYYDRWTQVWWSGLESHNGLPRDLYRSLVSYIDFAILT